MHPIAILPKCHNFPHHNHTHPLPILLALELHLNGHTGIACVYISHLTNLPRTKGSTCSSAVLEEVMRQLNVVAKEEGGGGGGGGGGLLSGGDV